MKSIEELHILIKVIKKENLDDLSSIESLEKLKRYHHKFSELVEGWIRVCGLNQFVPFDEIKSTIDAEIIEMEQTFIRRPNPKMPNIYDTLLGWKHKLNYLKYEIDKKSYLGEDTNCYCDLRIANRIQPDFTVLSDYGRAVLYYEDDNYIIKQCDFCKTKWVNDYSPGSLRGWHEWNPEEFLIRELFANK